MRLVVRMVICRHCKKRITHLTSEVTATAGCSLGEDGFITIDNDLNSIAETNEWRCPKCNGFIDYNEDEARAFIKDKDELKEIVAEKLKNIKKLK